MDGQSRWMVWSRHVITPTPLLLIARVAPFIFHGVRCMGGVFL